MEYSTKLSDYDYELPKKFIAQCPIGGQSGDQDRDDCRLLVLHRDTGRIDHRRFYEIQEYMSPGDVLVLNDTRVIPARLFGHRETGGKVEGLILKAVESHGGIACTPAGPRAHEFGVWHVLLKCHGHLRAGERVTFGPKSAQHIVGVLIRRTETGRWFVKFEKGTDMAVQTDTQPNTNSRGEFLSVLEQVGHAPLPPYIRRDHDKRDVEELPTDSGSQRIREPFDEGPQGDKEMYQTVFAKTPGAIAAPTAGLHFTESLLNDLGRRGVVVKFVTLHVGIGTFQPVRVEHVANHKMHAEEFELPTETIAAILEARARAARIFATGTTACRVLETAAIKGVLGENNFNRYSRKVPTRTMRGETDLFIYPPYSFRVVDALVTNFHLPKSTLLLLVSAFATRRRVLDCYEEAKREGYRFYSYGDAMLVL